MLTQSLTHSLIMTATFAICYLHIDGLQHKGAMSTKPLFDKITQDTKVVCPVMWTYDICAVLLTPARTVTTDIVDKITNILQ